MKRLALAHFVVLWLGCGYAPELGTATQADQRPPGVLCTPSTWTPSATVPATGWCMWQPSYYMSPMPANIRMCDARIPPQAGEVEVHDAPSFGGNCAVLNWSVGGYFDWQTFQHYGWQTAAGIPGIPQVVIRSLRIGYGTRVTWSDRPLDCNQVACCDYSHGAQCVGTVANGTPGITEDFADLWSTLPGFKMASMVISRP